MNWRVGWQIFGLAVQFVFQMTVLSLNCATRWAISWRLALN